jgi:hypothetical protein
MRRIRTIFSRFKDRNSFGALEQFRNFTRRQNIVKKGNIPFFGPLARFFNEFQISPPTEPCLVLRSKNLRKDQDRLLVLYVSDVKLGILETRCSRDASSLAVILCVGEGAPVFESVPSFKSKLHTFRLGWMKFVLSTVFFPFSFPLVVQLF